MTTAEERCIGWRGVGRIDVAWLAAALLPRVDIISAFVSIYLHTYATFTNEIVKFNPGP